MVYKASIKLQSRHRAVSFHDITARVKEIVAESGLKDGIVVVYSHHTPAPSSPRSAPSICP